MLRNRLDSAGIIPKGSKVQHLSRRELSNPVEIDVLFEEYKQVYNLK